jgi:hypothetical protein
MPSTELLSTHLISTTGIIIAFTLIPTTKIRSAGRSNMGIRNSGCPITIYRRAIIGMGGDRIVVHHK